MSLLSSLFGSDSSGTLDPRELERLEEEARTARAGHKGAPLNRAGDLAYRAGQTDRALGYYGRAIDAYLEDQHLDAARGLANKIVRLHPEAVRTLCTLTWLDIAARHMATALLHLRDYVEAAERSRHHDLAAEQIHRMARLAPFPEFLSSAADALDQLDHEEKAAEVREWIKAEGSPHVIRENDALAEACMNAATRA
ncbi:MAG: hypothetical protein RQ745_05370 [Longimicrobiales bacterium]|nr:hypothetical protein [Longimicrobiales bacterium]